MLEQDRKKENLSLVAPGMQPDWYQELSAKSDALANSCSTPVETSLLFYEWLRALQVRGVTRDLEYFLGGVGLYDLLATAERNPGDAIRKLMVFEAGLAMGHGKAGQWRKIINQTHELRVIQRETNRAAPAKFNVFMRIFLILIAGANYSLARELGLTIVKNKLAKDVEYLLNRDGLL